MFINIAGLRTPARVAESGVSVLISLNHIYLEHIRFSFSFQLEYILLYSIKSSNLITESLFIIAPTIHIHNRKQISHSTSRIKTYLATPRQSISPQSHHSNPTAPLPGDQSGSPTETRGVYGYHVRTRRPTCPHGNPNDICHSIQVRSDPKAKYNPQRYHGIKTVHLLHVYGLMTGLFAWISRTALSYCICYTPSYVYNCRTERKCHSDHDLQVAYRFHASEARAIITLKISIQGGPINPLHRFCRFIIHLNTLFRWTYQAIWMLCALNLMSSRFTASIILAYTGLATTVMVVVNIKTTFSHH